VNDVALGVESHAFADFVRRLLVRLRTTVAISNSNNVGDTRVVEGRDCSRLPTRIPDRSRRVVGSMGFRTPGLWTLGLACARSSRRRLATDPRGSAAVDLRLCAIAHDPSAIIPTSRPQFAVSFTQPRMPPHRRHRSSSGMVAKVRGHDVWSVRDGHCGNDRRQGRHDFGKLGARSARLYSAAAKRRPLRSRSGDFP
jgi:hypothetical protein